MIALTDMTAAVVESFMMVFLFLMACGTSRRAGGRWVMGHEHVR